MWYPIVACNMVLDEASILVIRGANAVVQSRTMRLSASSLTLVRRRTGRLSRPRLCKSVPRRCMFLQILRSQARASQSVHAMKLSVKGREVQIDTDEDIAGSLRTSRRSSSMSSASAPSNATPSTRDGTCSVPLWLALSSLVLRCALLSRRAVNSFPTAALARVTTRSALRYEFVEEACIPAELQADGHEACLLHHQPRHQSHCTMA